ALLLGFTVSYFGHWYPWYQAMDADYKPQMEAANGVKSRADQAKAAFDAVAAEQRAKLETGERLLTNVDGRLVWPELVKVVNASLPPAEPPAQSTDKQPATQAGTPAGTPADKQGEKQPENNSTRGDLMITTFNSQRMDDVLRWFNGAVKTEWNRTHAGQDAADEKPEGNPEGETDSESTSEGDSAGDSGEESGGDAGAASEGEKKPGVVIELKGHHYHNNDPANAGGVYVQQTLIKNLAQGFVELPGKDGKPEKVAIKDLGVQYPVLVYSSDLKDVPNPAYDPTDPASKQPARLRRFDFIVQFWLTETPQSAREKAKQEAEAKPAEENAAPAEAGG
ncbi:MAG: hypothetical protein WD176_03310, partial [Pirellulales bacterium]